jgi:trehalose 6-phosphate phosphatase
MGFISERARLAKDAAEVAERIMISPHGFALFLDLDGTLLDIAPRPDEVVVVRGLVDHLDRLRSGLSGALAIVSGRKLADIDRFLHPLRFDAAAEHGSTIRLADGEPPAHAVGIDPRLVEELERELRAFDGVTLERKRSGLTAHYRAAPHSAEALRETILRTLARFDTDLRLLAGRCVFELLQSRASKARAVETLSGNFPFAGRRPVFIGDDASDEEACVLVERAGGAALAVAGEHFSRERAAFGSPAEVRSWIAALAAELSGNGRSCRR